MKILIEIPTWLGDCVMITPAVESIIKIYPNAQLTIFGSPVAVEVFKYHPNIVKIIIDTSKKSGNRYKNLYNLAKIAGRFDLAISFRRNFSTKFLLFFINAKQKYHYQRYTKKQIHQVIRYNDFINKALNINTIPDKLQIYLQNNPTKKNILGINPGATYGSAKRWYPQKFAEVVNQVSHKFDEIIIFGGSGEVDIAKDIETNLSISNYQNLAGKLSVEQLIAKIATLNTFITADSGPMHLSSCFNVKTIALFGATKDAETSPWNEKNSTIIRQNTEKLDCTPCMQRKCSLKHHKCMKNITSEMVIAQIN